MHIYLWIDLFIYKTNIFSLWGDKLKKKVSEIEKYEDKLEHVELKETGEVLRANDDEQIAGKADNDEIENEDKVEKELESEFVVLVPCAVDNNLGETCVENIELENKEEAFIGPRLPRVKSDEEFKTLMDKLLGDKYS